MAGHKQAGHDVCERRSGGRLTGLKPPVSTRQQRLPGSPSQGLCRLLLQLLFPLQRQPPLRDVTSARRWLTGAVCDGLRAPRGDPLRHRGRQLGQATSRPSRWTAANAAAPLIHRPVTPAGYADPEPHRAHHGAPPTADAADPPIRRAAAGEKQPTSAPAKD